MRRKMQQPGQQVDEWRELWGAFAAPTAAEPAPLWLQATAPAYHSAQTDAPWCGLFQRTTRALLVCRLDGALLDANDQMLELLGTDRAQALALNFLADYSGPNNNVATFWRHRDQVCSGEVQQFAWQVRRPRDGVLLPAQVGLRRLFWGNALHLLISVELATRQPTDPAHAPQMGTNDMLTRLPAYALLNEGIRAALAARQQGNAGDFALLLIDLDRFAVVNLGLGHAVGDALLRTMAARICGCAGIASMVARFSGDRFLVLLNQAHNARTAWQMAEQIQRTLAVPVPIQGRDIVTTASIGIVVSSDTTHTTHGPDELLRDAETALAAAKAAGPAHIRIFEPHLRARAIDRLHLEADLRRALVEQQLHVFYQPIVRLTDSQPVGFEALVRWQHPQRGFLAPGEFLPVAETTGLISQIDHYVCATAIRQMHAWQRQAPTRCPLLLNINISGTTLYRGDILSHIERLLDETGPRAGCLQLELTEHVLAAPGEAAHTTLVRLKALGLQLCIDDFGTGYSAFSYLQHLPVDMLKIDRSFIVELGSNPRSQAIVRTILQLASELGIAVVAEGVETEAQRNYLRALGCTYAQGFLFAAACDHRAATALLQK